MTVGDERMRQRRLPHLFVAVERFVPVGKGYRSAGSGRPFSAVGQLFVSVSTTLDYGRSWRHFLDGDPKHLLPPSIETRQLDRSRPAAVHQYSNLRNC